MNTHNTFTGEKVLVTGASGFIGSHLLAPLANAGAEVHAVSRGLDSHRQRGFRWWQADLADMSVIRDLLQSIKPDVIYHLASHVTGGRDLSLVVPTFRSNLVSTVNLLTVLGEIGCRRIVLTGSMEEPDARELSPVACSPYAVAKWSSAAYARMFHALYQLPVVILRVFMVYGPAQKDLSKLVPYVITSLLRGEAPKLTNGLREVDWIYIEDVVNALLVATQTSGIEGGTIDVGSGKLVSIRTVVEHLVRIINPQILPFFGALPERPLEQVRAADIANSHTRIGWRPSILLEDGLKRTVEWYRNQPEQSYAG